MNILLLVPRFLLAAWLAAQCDIALANEYSTIEYASTLNALLPKDQAAGFSEVLSADEVVRWKFVPANEPLAAAGLLVFISPDASGAPQPHWREVLSARNLHWIAAENFGNEKPTAQRVLAAIMAVTLAQREFNLNRKRIYIGGMSGGGRAASTAITTFPQLFAGALYIVGADYPSDGARARLPQIAANRYVFLTGRRDFNRDEMKMIHRRYVADGATHTLLMDLRHFGHQYPNAREFNRALEFLDGAQQ
jgi:predicted esterase